jgi:hypothetical protein
MDGESGCVFYHYRISFVEPFFCVAVVTVLCRPNIYKGFTEKDVKE